MDCEHIEPLNFYTALDYVSDAYDPVSEHTSHERWTPREKFARQRNLDPRRQTVTLIRESLLPNMVDDLFEDLTDLLDAYEDGLQPGGRTGKHRLALYRHRKLIDEAEQIERASSGTRHAASAVLAVARLRYDASWNTFWMVYALAIQLQEAFCDSGEDETDPFRQTDELLGFSLKDDE